MHPRPSLVLPLLLLVSLTLPIEARAIQSPFEIQLGPGDAVRVEVKDEPDLGGEFRVAADGYVLMPVVGRVHVTRRPFSEVSSELAAGFAAVLTTPVVQFTPLLRIAVLGEVRQPGLLTVDPTHTLADVLALAGGLTPVGDDQRITLLRGGESVVSRLAASSSGPSSMLRSGDQLFVGRRSWLSDNAGILIGAAASVTAAAVTSLLIR